MTIHERPINAPAVAGDTDGLSAAQPPVLDTVALLDHRTRLGLLSPAVAPPGRYLEAVSGATDKSGRGAVDRREPRLIALGGPIMHVGRGLVADVRLEDPHVSRRHAIIAVRGEGVRVLDDRSANGTYVNGLRVTVAELADGDIVRAGRAAFRYRELGLVRRRRPLRRFPIVPAWQAAGVARAAA